MPGPDVFEIIAPAQWTAPLVFNSPHSGNVLPDDLIALSRLDERTLHLSEDCFVDELFGGCIAAGAPMLRSLLSRSYLDLNREPYELDPRMFVEDLPAHFNIGSPRVACGLGTVPRIVTEGQDIYRGRIPLAQALSRIESAYRPYHRALAALLNEAHEATGVVLLVDCHSMPSTAVADLKGSQGKRIDVVLGDRFGAACDSAITRRARESLEAAGLHVILNRPYAGGFNTENHGRPALGRNALQIEINRTLYMDEQRQTKASGFAALKKVMTRLCNDLGQYVSDMAGLSNLPMAAE